MKIDISYRNINKESHESTRQYVRQLVQRHLDQELSAFNPSQLRLHVMVEHEKLQYRVTLRLHLPPKKILVAREANENIRTALQEAVHELARQAKRHQAHISGREQWKRKARRRELETLKSEVGSLEPAPPEMEVTLASLLPRLEGFIRHELTYLRANGDLPERYPSIADVRDEVFLTLQSQWNELDHSAHALYQTALKTTHAVLKREVAQAQAHSEEISLEARPPADAEDQAEAMVQEENKEFYQPDEYLHIEDLIPDQEVASPEERLEAEAAEVCYQLLGELPIQWRRVVMLVERESLTPAEVAENVLDLTVDEVKNILEKAEAYLRAHLDEQGYAQCQLQTLLKR